MYRDLRCHLPRSADRHGRLRDDDHLTGHVLADFARHRQNMLQISGAILVRRRSDRDEENIGGADGGRDVGREVETPVLLVSLDEILEAGLVDRKNVLLQALDFRCDHIRAYDVVAGFGETCSHHESDVSGSNNRNIHELLVISGDCEAGARTAWRGRRRMAGETRGCVAGVHQEGRKIHDALIVDRGMIGDDHDDIG